MRELVPVVFPKIESHVRFNFWKNDWDELPHHSPAFEVDEDIYQGGDVVCNP